ncbi:MAG: ATP synthase F1 subunit delta [Nitrospirae bacterium]|nr:ATP synthase F1 subunit delta [Nitrospirota bacterium]
MKPTQAVKRYARMFFNTVGVEDVPRALNELAVVREMMAKSREFKGVLENPLFSGEDRKKVMKEASAKLKLSEDTTKFLLFLSEKAVISALSTLVDFLTALYLEKKRRARAVVMTPVDTSGKYSEALKASLKRLTGREVDIEYVVDPSLLGGVVVKVGSTMYDSSLKGQLRLLKEDLIKR